MNYFEIKKAVAGGVAGAYYGEASANASQFDSTNFSEDTKRQLSYLQFVSLDDAESEELNNLLSEMGRIYGSYQVYKKHCLFELSIPIKSNIHLY